MRRTQLNRKRKFNNSNESNSEPPSKRQKQNTNSNNSSSTTTTDSITKLEYLFSNFHQPCNLTVGGKCKSLPLLPGLYISGIGHISLPISDGSLQQFKSLSLNSNSKQFHFENPEWNKQINSLITSTAIKLGCDMNFVQYVNGYCDKLLIYEKENHQQFIQNTDKKPFDEIFATLIIQLPSNYKVYDNKHILMVNHKDNTKKYYFNDCKYNIYYASYYVNNIDLIHKINEIESGICVFVTYNLYWNGPKNKIPQISNIETMTHQIDNIFTDLMHLTLFNDPNLTNFRDSAHSINSSNHKPIAIKLDHVYKDEKLSQKGIRALRGKDFTKINGLNQYSSVKQKNFHIFFTKVTNTKIKYIGFEGERISDPGTFVNNTWYSVNGKKFDLGKYIKINSKILKEYGIINDKGNWTKDSEIKTENYDSSMKTTIKYSSYIALLFVKEYEFSKLNCIDGWIEWIKYILSQNINNNISSDMKNIIDKFNEYRDRHRVPTILSLLLKSNNFDLISYFIDKCLIPKNIHFHDRRWGQNIMDKISEIIIKYGWNEPINHSVLNLMDCMNSKNNVLNNGNIIKHYTSFLKLMENSNYYHYKFEELFEIIDESLLIKKLNVTHAINKEIAEYALDICFEEISNKLWENIVKKFNLNGNNIINNKYGQGMERLGDSNIVCILQFILSCNADKKKQKLMLETFNKAYNIKINQTTQYKVLQRWIIYVNTLQIDNDISPQIEMLINKFSKHHCKLIASIFKILMKTNKLELIIRFINDKLIGYRIGLHGDISTKNYNQCIFNLILKYGWKDSVKSSILKLLDCINNKEIDNYCLLPKLIKNAIINNKYKQDEDADIIMLNDTTNECLEICWIEIANKVWENVMIKLEFNKNGKIMKQLCANSIVCMVELIILYESQWDNKYKTNIYKIFDNIYRINVDNKTQSEIISLIMSWNKESLYSHECIQTIFRERINYLSTVKKPSITWEMKILTGQKIYDYELKVFLKSKDKTFVKKGFNGIAEARSWARSSGANPVVIRCEARGRGRGSTVKVEKIFNQQKIRQYTTNINDLKLLLSFMK